MSTFDNPFVTGTIAVIATGAVMGAVYKVPPLVWRLLRNRLITTIEIDNTDSAFRWVRAWLGEVARSRYLNAVTTFPDASVSYGPTRGAPVVHLTPRGTCFFRFAGRRFIAWHRKDAVQNSIEYRETVTLQCWRGTRDLYKSLIEAAREFAENQGGRRVEVWVPNGNEWTLSDRKLPRERDSLVLADGVLETLLGDAAAFRAARDWYARMGIPWHRSYLLHGAPGNGKSSAVHVLASELALNISVANLSHFTDDGQLVCCLSKVPPGHVLLLEDIDASFDGRTSRPGCRVSFAALLNALDGVTAKEGAIVVMTTNHVERLDPALIRPGRADLRVLLDNATPAQAAEMFRRFFPGEYAPAATAFGDCAARGNVSMARVQELLMEHRDSWSAALEAAERLRRQADEPVAKDIAA